MKLDEENWELISRFLDGDLSPEELVKLASELSRSPDLYKRVRQQLLLAELLSQKFDTQRSERMFLEAFKTRMRAEEDGAAFVSKVQGSLAERPAAKPESLRSTRRTLRRQSSNQNPAWGAWVVAAAGILAAVTLFLVLSPAEPDPAASQKAKEASARAAKEVEQRQQSERDRMDRERVLAESEAKRRAAEARLEEIRRKQEELARLAAQPGQIPAEQEKREAEEKRLAGDKERIEQELREAAGLSRRAERPAPEKPAQEEKPLSPSATSVDASQGTTRAALAKVEDISGEASIVAKDGKSPVAAGTNLLPGQGLRTGGGTSRIVLRFPDKTQVDLGPDTLLAELKTDSGKRLTLSQGTVRAVVAKQPKDQPMMFITPHGQAKVVGTTLRLVVDPDPKKGTKLEVEEGKVELKNLAGKTVMVESGHYAVAAVGVELVARVLPPRTRPAAYIWHEAKQSWAAILQTVKLEPNQSYTLSAWIQTSIPTMLELNSVFNTGQFPGGILGVRTESGAILAQQAFGPSEHYASRTLTFKADSNGRAVIFVGFANGANAAAWIHVDDWSLTAKGADGTNLIQDPDYRAQSLSSQKLSAPWWVEGTGDIGVEFTLGRIPAK